MVMDTKYIVSKLVEYGVPVSDAWILGAVAKGESGYRAGAVGDAGESFGLFQIHIPAHYDKLQKFTGSADRSVWEQWLKNAENNIRAAAAVYSSQGLGAWTIYNTGAYKPYVGANFTVTGGGSAPVPGKGDGTSISQGEWSAWEKFKRSDLGKKLGLDSDIPSQDMYSPEKINEFIEARKKYGLETDHLEEYKNNIRPEGAGDLSLLQGGARLFIMVGLVVVLVVVFVKALPGPPLPTLKGGK